MGTEAFLTLFLGHVWCRPREIQAEFHALTSSPDVAKVRFSMLFKDGQRVFVIPIRYWESVEPTPAIVVGDQNTKWHVNFMGTYSLCLLIEGEQSPTLCDPKSVFFNADKARAAAGAPRGSWRVWEKFWAGTSRPSVSSCTSRAMTSSRDSADSWVRPRISWRISRAHPYLRLWRAYAPT